MFNADCIEKLMIDLKVISKIGPGSKINTKEKYLEIDDTTWWQGALRWYRGDSRQTTSDKIHITISSCSHVINNAISEYRENQDTPIPMFLNSSPKDFLIMIHTGLKGANTGVENLRDTYIHDNTLSSKLEFDILSISRQINLIEKYINMESSTF